MADRPIFTYGPLPLIDAKCDSCGSGWQVATSGELGKWTCEAGYFVICRQCALALVMELSSWLDAPEFTPAYDDPEEPS